MEAATVAWHPLGWTPIAFSEIEPFPKALLLHKYPNIPNYGDLTKFDEPGNKWPLSNGDVDLIVGGTPCQAWSVAGKRLGLDDPRGRVALAYAGLIEKLRPKWIVWENVPGVYSAGKPGGADFAAFVGTLVKLGYNIAYRTINAEHFGVPQRRRRCILVGYLGDWRPAAAVLFEPESLRRDIKKGRKKGEGITSGPEGGPGPSGGVTNVCATGVPYRKSKRASSETDDETWVEADKSNTLNNFDLGDTRTTHAVVHCSDVAPTVTSSGPPFSRTGNERVEAEALVVQPQPVAFQPGNLMRRAGSDPSTEVFPTVKCDTGDQSPHVATPSPMAVRRLTPEECEALQGFPKGYSRIPWKGKPAEECPDGPRYKACGNSMAVPVMRWVGERIAEVEKLLSEQAKP
jgi:DNA (cytosine-5)-methyltransferase 1